MLKLILAASAIVACSTSLIHPPAPLLVWNETPSAPRGLYWIRPGAKPKVGDLLLITPPASLASFLAERNYLPLGVPLLKRMAAAQGQVVCRHELILTIDGRAYATALTVDRLGRALPRWRGCMRLTERQFFPLGSANAGSFDGRYFGALPLSAIIGRAIPLWTVPY